jgi:hypothetical protein
MKQSYSTYNHEASTELAALHTGATVLHPLQRKIDASPRQQTQENRLMQLQDVSTQPKANGLPLPLRTGIEALSGMDMGNVTVHHNSAKPAQLNALAYAQGNDIHLGPGQDKHLPHEAWHVVQQAQGRVQPTRRMKSNVPINDHADLESEADRMGVRALRMGGSVQQKTGADSAPWQSVGLLQARLPSHVPVQRNIWSGWEPQFGKIDPETERMAKLGMAIVEFLRGISINARIGGSLSASMFGGQRKPVDIDIDVSGTLEDNERAQKRFFNLGAEPGVPLMTGTDLFFIDSPTKTSSGIQIIYRCMKTERVLDPSKDEDEVILKDLVKDRQALDAFTVYVDFTSEKIFEMSGLVVDKEGENKGHYEPLFMIASYLNRLAPNTLKNEDPKNDQGQIKSLLVAMVRNQLKDDFGEERLKECLGDIKRKMFAQHVEPSNKNMELMGRLFDDMVPVVIGEF